MKQTVRLFFAAALLAALFACKVPEPAVESTHVPDPTPISEEAVALATPEMTPRADARADSGTVAGTDARADA